MYIMGVSRAAHRNQFTVLNNICVLGICGAGLFSRYKFWVLDWLDCFAHSAYYFTSSEFFPIGINNKSRRLVAQSVSDAALLRCELRIYDRFGRPSVSFYDLGKPADLGLLHGLLAFRITMHSCVFLYLKAQVLPYHLAFECRRRSI